MGGDSLLKAASGYGFDEEWVALNVRGGRYGGLEGRFAGLEAFERWEGDLGTASRQCAGGVDAGLVLCSLHSSAYLTNTRILAWMGVKKGYIAFDGVDKAEILGLLDRQVNTANELTERITRLFAMTEAPCEEYQTLIGEIIKDIGEITSIEKGITEHEECK